MRDRSVAELRTYLERKRVEPGVIDVVVEELTTTGILDDARYAERFTEDKRALDGWGSDRIESELERRGIARELIEPALASRSRADELAAARSLLDQRFGGPLADDRARNRAWQLLVRRGYDSEIAYDAVRAHAAAA